MVGFIGVVHGVNKKDFVALIKDLICMGITIVITLLVAWYICDCLEDTEFIPEAFWAMSIFFSVYSFLSLIAWISKKFVFKKVRV
jgi:hypothetical protein